MLRWISFLAVIAGISGQDVLGQDVLRAAGVNLDTNSLNVEEITQIMSESDPSGKNHSLRIRLSKYHPGLRDITKWNFIQHRNDADRKFTTYSTDADGRNPTTQTELIFKGNLVECDTFILRAMNGSQEVAMAFHSHDIVDFKSQANWVGEAREMDQSSIRVVPGEKLGEITIDGVPCYDSESPCYYIAPEVKPPLIKRCINISEGEIFLLQCDERVASFTEIEETLSMELTDEGFLTIGFVYEEYFAAEVVAYDPQNSSRLFSQYPYKCRLPIGGSWEKGDNVTCRHDLSLPDDQDDMMVLVVVTDTFGNVTKSKLQYFDKNADKKLMIEKISRISRDNDPTRQDIRVTFNHQSLPNIAEWRFTLKSNYEDLITYNVDADGTNPSTQTEAIFEGPLGHANSVALQAYDTDEKLSAMSFVSLDIQDVNQYVSWVGGKKNGYSSSLRVVAEDNFPEIHVGEERCTKEDSPCYYVTPNPKPEIQERCKSHDLGGGKAVQVCDDRSNELPVIKPEPSVDVDDNGNLEVSFELSDDDSSRLEVVAYDHEDHTKILSSDGYSCEIPVGNGDKDTMTCQHKLNLQENQGDFMVLIVKVDSDNVATSSIILHYGSKPVADKNVGMIIGIVVGVIVGIALIVFFIFCLMKRRETDATGPADSIRYMAAKREEPKDNEAGVTSS